MRCRRTPRAEAARFQAGTGRAAERCSDLRSTLRVADEPIPEPAGVSVATMAPVLADTTRRGSLEMSTGSAELSRQGRAGLLSHRLLDVSPSQAGIAPRRALASASCARVCRLHSGGWRSDHGVLSSARLNPGSVPL